MDTNTEYKELRAYQVDALQSYLNILRTTTYPPTPAGDAAFNRVCAAIRGVKQAIIDGDRKQDELQRELRKSRPLTER